MKGVKSIIVTVLATAAAGTLGVASPARADTGVPFTITEDVNHGGVNTFTATGPLCPSGTFVDTVVAAGVANAWIPKENLLIRTTYVCADGSGTFDMLKHVLLEFTSDGSTNSGPVQILGGTGSYAGLVGHGIDNGVGSGNHGVGQITGFITAA